MREMLDEKGRTLARFLAEYDIDKYRRPSCAVDMAVFTDEQEPSVLLIRRRNHPYIGRWALPGGFVGFDETLEHAAARELEEETGVTDAELHPFGVFDAVDRDPRTRVISTGFYAVLPRERLCFRAGDDAADAALFCVTSVRELAHSAAASILGITLVGPALIECRARVLYGALGEKVVPLAKPGEGGLAADHDCILLSALRALNN